MTRIFFSLCMACLSLGLLGGCEEERGQTDDALCDCIHTDEQGNWDMQLSQACMELCVKTFGPELKGMEQWFRERCGYNLTHPDIEAKPPTEQALIAPAYTPRSNS